MSYQAESSEWFPLSARQQTRGYGREGVTEVFLVPGDHRDLALLQGLEQTFQRGFVGDLAQDQIGVGPVVGAVGQGGGEDGVAGLDGEVGVGQIGPTDDVDVTRGRFDLGHGFRLRCVPGGFQRHFPTGRKAGGKDCTYGLQACAWRSLVAELLPHVDRAGVEPATQGFSTLCSTG